MAIEYSFKNWGGFSVIGLRIVSVFEYIHFFVILLLVHYLRGQKWFLYSLLEEHRPTFGVYIVGFPRYAESLTIPPTVTDSLNVANCIHTIHSIICPMTFQMSKESPKHFSY